MWCSQSWVKCLEMKALNPQAVWLHLITRSAWRPQIVIMLGGRSCPEHAQPLSDRARAGGVMGCSERWPSGPGGVPDWLPLFVANNWDLIWEISKAPTTSALRTDRFPSLVLKEMSLHPILPGEDPELLRICSGHLLWMWHLDLSGLEQTIELDSGLMWVHCV